MRQEFSAKIKVAAFERVKGCCELCKTGIKLMAHDRSHHDIKTRRDDVPAIAKSKRIRRRAAGIKKPSRFACSHNSKYRKKIDGSVVLR